MSRWLYPFERQTLWNRRRRLAILLLIGFLVLSLLDRTLYHATFAAADLLAPQAIETSQKKIGIGAAERQLAAAETVRKQLESKDGVMALRTAGYLPAW